MGVGRWIWRSSTLGRTIDTVKNIIDEGSVVDGIKRTAREDYTEDNPLTSAIYKDGKYDGKIEGYVAASDEYEEKLLKQADEFLKQKTVFEYERDNYEKLLDEYEQEIERLSSKCSRSEAENLLLQQLLLKERKLKKMAG
ncbi:hypothetical protein [Hungatella effluvii]|uniref:hypothetical protein n=1 Tax=Hungatella effluvii TaxID=1096246 RepID=UPI0022E2F414|nr:hypothetical protein [Hungatella effluvii]